MLPPVRTYRYQIDGTAAQGQSWKTVGYMTDRANDLANCFDLMMRDSFIQLTHGRAVYGKPGLACNGPYEILSILIQLEKRDDR